MNLTIKDKIDAAYSAAWTALMKSLTDNGIEFQGTDSAVYVDDPETKTTWFFGLNLDKCAEYGGED